MADEPVALSRAQLACWSQFFLYPGLASLFGGVIAGTPTPSVTTEIFERLGLLLLGITLGLLLAQALGAPKRRARRSPIP